MFILSNLLIYFIIKILLIIITYFKKNKIIIKEYEFKSNQAN